MRSLVRHGPFDRHIATTWKYVNYGMSSSHRVGELWVTHATRQVAWQHLDHTTNWHGSFEDSAIRMIVRFDCQGRDDHIQSTVLFPHATTRAVGRHRLQRTPR